PPAWLRREIGLRQVLPRPSDANLKADEVVARTRGLVIIPHTSTTVDEAVGIWPEGGWGEAAEAAIDVLGYPALLNKKTEQWASAQPGRPVKDRNVRIFFENALALVPRLDELEKLRHLDLRMGVWMLYQSYIDALDWNDEWLYDLVKRNRYLRRLSVVLDIRRWHSDELHTEPTITLQRLLGAEAEPSLSDENRTWTKMADRPKAGYVSIADRTRLRYVSIIMPGVTMWASPSRVFSCLQSVTTFVLICNIFDSTVASGVLAYQVAEHFGDTLETLSVIVLSDDQSSISSFYDHSIRNLVPMRDEDDEYDENDGGGNGQSKQGSRSLRSFDECSSTVVLPRLKEFHFEGR
ncbi:hypothetical protein A4X13_0g9641, partial [Tilletia indica]